jgi:hypothetical protein
MDIVFNDQPWAAALQIHNGLCVLLPIREPDHGEIYTIIVIASDLKIG